MYNVIVNLMASALLISAYTFIPEVAYARDQTQVGVQATETEVETNVGNSVETNVGNSSTAEAGQQQGIEAFNGDTVVNPNVEIDSDDFKDHAETAARVRGAAFLCDVAGVSVQTGTVGGSIGAPTYECRVYRQQEVMKELATDTSNFAKMQRFFLWTSAIANGIGAIPRSLLGF